MVTRIVFATLILLATSFVITSATETNYSRRLDVIERGSFDRQQYQHECGSEENRNIGTFSVYDYSVVLIMLVVSLGIGVFYGFFSGSETSEDFLHGTEMCLLPVSLSLTTSFITAIELLGNPSEMFFNGTQFSLIILSIFMVIPVAVKIFYPIYFKLEVTSCYEFLGLRFGNDIRVFGAILYIIQMSFYTAVSVYAPAIALSKATGLNTRLAVFLIYVVCIFYASQGGMKAVVIADTFQVSVFSFDRNINGQWVQIFYLQATVLAFSLVLVVALGYVYTGGFTEVVEKAELGNRLEFLNESVNPVERHTIWSVVIGGFFYWTSLLCTNQASVQKCMSLRCLRKAKKALTIAIFGKWTKWPRERLRNFIHLIVLIRFGHHFPDQFLHGSYLVRTL